MSHRKGDRVRIMRHQHGWCDGRVEGTVAKVNEPLPGRKNPSYDVVTDDGHEYTCDYPRDIKSVSR